MTVNYMKNMKNTHHTLSPLYPFSRLADLPHPVILLFCCLDIPPQNMPHILLSFFFCPFKSHGWLLILNARGCCLRNISSTSSGLTQTKSHSFNLSMCIHYSMSVMSPYACITALHLSVSHTNLAWLFLFLLSCLVFYQVWLSLWKGDHICIRG